MQNPLLKKLQIKTGFKVKVKNQPANFEEIFGDLSAAVTLVDDDDFQALLIFAITKAEMDAAILAEQRSFDEKLISWIIYPKAKAKIASDLNLMKNWEDLKSYQLTPCASAAIDDVWTSIRVKPITEVKKSGLGNAEIKKSEFGDFIDVANKTVKLPPDVKTELERHPSALQYFETLAYSHKKEYVLWILSAKQEKTRIDRINKMVEKLLTGKKNPNEK